MRLMDEEQMRHPSRGSRQVVDHRRHCGYAVNRKKVQRMMRNIGIKGLALRPGTTRPALRIRAYPFLLRDLEISQPEQVWCSDIKYISIRGGYLYLMAVMDWYSRYVLCWRLSNSMDVDFCMEALDEALGLGKPQLFNPDQGSQFTSLAFTSRPEDSAVAVSMDGKGRAIENVMIERLWRNVKCEDVYLKENA
jgi:putative transposase